MDKDTEIKESNILTLQHIQVPFDMATYDKKTNFFEFVRDRLDRSLMSYVTKINKNDRVTRFICDAIIPDTIKPLKITSIGHNCFLVCCKEVRGIKLRNYRALKIKGLKNVSLFEKNEKHDDAPIIKSQEPLSKLVLFHSIKDVHNMLFKEERYDDIRELYMHEDIHKKMHKQHKHIMTISDVFSSNSPTDRFSLERNSTEENQLRPFSQDRAINLLKRSRNTSETLKRDRLRATNKKF